MSDDGFKAAFEEALPRFLADPKSDELLASLRAGAWSRNGCMAFATALAACLGGTLLSIGWYELLADHVVLSFDGMLLDAEGVYTEQELLEKRSSLAHAPLGIWAVTSSTVTPALGNERHRTELAALLASYLPKSAARRRIDREVAPSLERRRRPRKEATAQNSKTGRV